ncbi:MAG: restriction endonuclease subunit S [Candidatus Competibacteraceae bacterium]
MIEGLKTYAEYKDSGQEWLGRVPKHWDVRRTKLILREVDSRSTTGNEQLLRVSQYTGVTQRKSADGSDAPDTRAASLIGYKRVSVNDLVINIMLAWNGSMGVSRFDGIASPAYCVYRFNKGVQPWYFHQLFRLPLYKGRIKTASTGVVESRLRLYSDDLGRIEALLPPPDEQAAIVRFLDHANRKIDGFIRAKRKLIGLLNEQKQAIIHHAVTRGLDPDVPLKPSGIPWLGDIPKHWEVSCLRMRYSVELGKMLDAKKITGRHLIPYLRNRDVQWDKILVENLPVMDISPAEFPRYTVRKGDLLVCEGGQVGRCAFWNEELPICGFQKALHRIRASKPTQDFPRFFFYQMQLAAGLGIFAADGNENTIAHLTCEKLRRHRFSFPPFTEQQSIAQYLDSELQTLNTAITRTEREIALMQEYRTRLTADIVTGKLDVREAAAKLPDLPTDPAAELFTGASPEHTDILDEIEPEES